MAWAIAGVLFGALVGVPSLWRWEATSSPALEALVGQAILRGGAAADIHRHLPLSYDIADDDPVGAGVFPVAGRPGS